MILYNCLKLGVKSAVRYGSQLQWQQLVNSGGPKLSRELFHFPSWNLNSFSELWSVSCKVLPKTPQWWCVIVSSSVNGKIERREADNLLQRNLIGKQGWRIPGSVILMQDQVPEKWCQCHLVGKNQFGDLEVEGKREGRNMRRRKDGRIKRTEEWKRITLAIRPCSKHRSPPSSLFDT